MLFENFLCPLLADIYYVDTYSGGAGPTPPVLYQYYLLDNSGENILTNEGGDPNVIFINITGVQPLEEYSFLNNDGENILVDNDENVLVLS